METRTNLDQSILDQINNNGVRLITGDILQQLLIDISASTLNLTSDEYKLLRNLDGTKTYESGETFISNNIIYKVNDGETHTGALDLSVLSVIGDNALVVDSATQALGASIINGVLSIGQSSSSSSGLLSQVDYTNIFSHISDTSNPHSTEIDDIPNLSSSLDSKLLADNYSVLATTTNGVDFTATLPGNVSFVDKPKIIAVRFFTGVPQSDLPTTGVTTLNINNLGAVPLLKLDGAGTIIPNELNGNLTYLLHSGTNSQSLTQSYFINGLVSETTSSGSDGVTLVRQLPTVIPVEGDTAFQGTMTGVYAPALSTSTADGVHSFTWEITGDGTNAPDLSALGVSISGDPLSATSVNFGSAVGIDGVFRTANNRVTPINDNTAPTSSILELSATNFDGTATFTEELSSAVLDTVNFTANGDAVTGVTISNVLLNTDVVSFDVAKQGSTESTGLATLQLVFTVTDLNGNTGQVTTNTVTLTNEVGNLTDRTIGTLQEATVSGNTLTAVSPSSWGGQGLVNGNFVDGAIVEAEPSSFRTAIFLNTASTNLSVSTHDLGVILTNNTTYRVRELSTANTDTTTLFEAGDKVGFEFSGTSLEIYVKRSSGTKIVLETVTVSQAASYRVHLLINSDGFSIGNVKGSGFS